MGGLRRNGRFSHVHRLYRASRGIPRGQRSSVTSGSPSPAPLPSASGPRRLTTTPRVASSRSELIRVDLSTPRIPERARILISTERERSTLVLMRSAPWSFRVLVVLLRFDLPSVLIGSDAPSV